MARKTPRSAEEQRAYRERVKALKAQQGEVSEQEIRNEWGYTSSEDRTRDTRTAAAAKMVGECSEEQRAEMWQLGYAGEPCPYDPLATGHSAEITAWAKGVWQRQANAQQAYSADRTKRAEAYAAWDSTGRPSKTMKIPPVGGSDFKGGSVG